MFACPRHVASSSKLTRLPLSSRPSARQPGRKLRAPSHDTSRRIESHQADMYELTNHLCRYSNGDKVSFLSGQHSGDHEVEHALHLVGVGRLLVGDHDRVDESKHIEQVHLFTHDACGLCPLEEHIS